jgi:hypothetical protein
MAALASWHVNYHLANSDLPFLDEAGLDVHQAMLDQIKSSKEHVEKLIADARDNLRRDMFE